MPKTSSCGSVVLARTLNGGLAVPDAWSQSPPQLPALYRDYAADSVLPERSATLDPPKLTARRMTRMRQEPGDCVLVPCHLCTYTVHVHSVALARSWPEAVASTPDRDLTK